MIHPTPIPFLWRQGLEPASSAVTGQCPVTAIIYPKHSAWNSTSHAGCLPPPQAAVCNLKETGFQRLPPCQLDSPAGSQNPNVGSGKPGLRASPSLGVRPGSGLSSRHPHSMQAWVLEKGFQRSWIVGCRLPIPDPLPGRGLAKPRPSSRTPNPASPFPRSFPFRDRALRGQAPAITAPQRRRGSRPARAGLVAGTGGVPSWAPPRGAGPYKGKVDPRPSVGPIWGTRDALRTSAPAHACELGAGLCGKGAPGATNTTCAGATNTTCASATHPDALRLGPALEMGH